MKKILVFVLGMVSGLALLGQPPVSWTYTAKKIKDKTYEVRAIATIATGWYIYAQKQPVGSVGQPTEISIARNPLLSTPYTPVLEEGNVICKRYLTLGTRANTYEETVSFMVKLRLKAPVKTSIACTILYQPVTPICVWHRSG